MNTEINVVNKMWKYGILKTKIGFLQVFNGEWSSVKHLKWLDEHTISLYLTSKTWCKGYQDTIVYSNFRCCFILNCLMYTGPTP
jgi:hypothetical protein